MTWVCTRSPRAAWAWLVVGLLLGLAPREADASGRSRGGGIGPQLATAPYDGRYLSLGLNLAYEGLPTGDGEEGFLRGDLYPMVGLEASVVQLESRNLFWVGGYVDLTHTFPNQATRMSIGPEIGWGPVGVDLGLTGELRDGRVGGGFQVRGMLTVGYVAAYVSYISTYNANTRNFQPSAQVGLLLKLPFILAITGEPWRPGA
ncbi:hypothetical protein JGU66_21640 [Myxococcaceae bacterium JPH2]|nr:hypothetical protein [Myxococcaceae bacterium JPH2]